MKVVKLFVNLNAAGVNNGNTGEISLQGRHPKNKRNVFF